MVKGDWVLFCPSIGLVCQIRDGGGQNALLGGLRPELAVENGGHQGVEGGLGVRQFLHK
jgi:hypothetical protein